MPKLQGRKTAKPAYRQAGSRPETVHLPGALSIPFEELKQRLGELPRHKTIAVYCRGTFSTRADEAVQLLRSPGFDAVRLEETFLDHQILFEEN